MYAMGGGSSFIAYFFCMLALLSFRSVGWRIESFERNATAFFLAFCGAAALSLVLLALLGRKRGMRRSSASASGVLMALGPLSALLDLLLTGRACAPLMLASFALSGCGYAFGLLAWGRILSEKAPADSKKQVLADSCVSMAAMAAVSLLPGWFGLAVLVVSGALSGLVAYLRMPPEPQVDPSSEPSDVRVATRTAIPWSAYFVNGAMWTVLGMLWVLLGEVCVFDGAFDWIGVAVIAAVAASIVCLVRLHFRPPFDLGRASWMAVPLMMTSLVIYVVGDAEAFRFAVLLVEFSTALSFLHLTGHLATLAHRPDLSSDQLFSWGWLASFGGMFLGVSAGVVCRMAGAAAIRLVLPIMAGALTMTLIVSMRSVEGIMLARIRTSAPGEGGGADAAKDAGACGGASGNAEDGADADVGSAGRGAEAESDDREVRERAFRRIGLSARERDVAALLLQGRSQAVIADQLCIAASTVNTHVKHIYRKAGVNSKQELIDLCLNGGSHE